MREFLSHLIYIIQSEFPINAESTDDLDYGFLEQHEEGIPEKLPEDKNLDMSRRERVLLDPLGASERSDKKQKNTNSGLLL